MLIISGVTRHREIQELVVRRGFVSLRAHPELARETVRMTEAGVLRRLHPGMYVAASADLDFHQSLRAAMAWAPRAVVTGQAAAKMSIWPELRVDAIDLASPVALAPQRGIRVAKRQIPAEFVDVDRGIRRSSPALTTADLIPDLGSGIVVRAFRSGLTPDDILSVLDLTAYRRGHALRRAILGDHRGLPWSEAEQELHQLLRNAGITGWVANRRIPLGDGRTKIFDVIFEELNVVIEVDGYAFHHQERRETYERDRFAASTLTAQGWHVIRITPRQIADMPKWVIAVVEATLQRARGEQSAGIWTSIRS